MPISARKHGTRLPGEWAWHAGPPGGVAGSRGRRSGRTHATYLARPGRRRSRQARRGRSSACQLRGYSLSAPEPPQSHGGQSAASMPGAGGRGNPPAGRHTAGSGRRGQASRAGGAEALGAGRGAGAASPAAVWGPGRPGLGRAWGTPRRHFAEMASAPVL